MALEQVTTAVITVHSKSMSLAILLVIVHILCLGGSMCESGSGMCGSLMVALLMELHR